MKNVDQGDAVTRQKARKTSCADCNSRPLLKAGNAWWHVANVEQSQKSTQCSNQPGQLSFWHSLTWFLWSKALYVMHRSVIHLNTAVPESGAVYGDPAYGETYQMLHLSAQSNLTKWYEKEDHYCFAMRSIFNEANGSWRGAVGRLTCSICLNDACEGVRRMKSAEQNHEDITEP